MDKINHFGKHFTQYRTTVMEKCITFYSQKFEYKKRYRGNAFQIVSSYELFFLLAHIGSGVSMISKTSPNNISH